MYISKLSIKNFRVFKNIEIDLSPQITVLIGENNAGKTSLLSALGLVLQKNSRVRPSVEDFHQNISPSKTPPEILVEITLKSSETDTDDDLAVVATWLTKPDEPWEAKLTYRYFLPDSYYQEFENLNPDYSKENFWNAVNKMLPKYVSRIFGGEYSNQLKAEPEMLSRLDITILGALRDAESQMFSGATPLLRKMLNAVLDTKDIPHKEKEQNKKDFDNASKLLVENVRNRINLDALFKLVQDTGAGDGGNPDLMGSITENDLLAALRMVIETSNGRIPLTRQGLGYNNLIYISLILSSLDFEDKHYSGDNALVFPVLAIEEPEAHLHPSMQYKLLKFLKLRMKEQKSSRQLLLTTHSTHITSASNLDSIVCLALDDDGSSYICYPGKLFPKTNDGKNSKKYIERYLDATKSSMLFSKSVFLVEGIAEQILLPLFAEYLKTPLEEYHVSILPVGGLTFKHFLPLFGGGSRVGQKPLHRRVACLVDADPTRKKKNEQNSRWTSCFPYQLNLDDKNYEYKVISTSVKNLNEQCKHSENIKVFHGKKTLEYDLASENCDDDILITDSCRLDKKLIKIINDQNFDVEKMKPFYDEPVISDVLNSDADDTWKRQNMFSSCFLFSVEKRKGSYALELSRKLMETLLDAESGGRKFNIPAHISNAISWVCGESDDE